MAIEWMVHVSQPFRKHSVSNFAKIIICWKIFAFTPKFCFENSKRKIYFAEFLGINMNLSYTLDQLWRSTPLLSMGFVDVSLLARSDIKDLIPVSKAMGN